MIKKIFSGGIDARSKAKHSYSQCGEDLIMKHLFHELKIEKPSYIDIGAHHPYYLNNTCLFYEQGARGINIEPDPTLYAAFVKERKNDINLNIGINLTRGELDFYIFNEPTLNTFVKEESERIHKEHPGYFVKEVKKIQTVPLHEVIEKHHAGKFPDLMSLDVEGLDEVIIRSVNFEKTLPTVICVETISFSTKGRGVKNSAILTFLESKDYMVYADTNINTIFVKRSAWFR